MDNPAASDEVVPPPGFRRTRLEVLETVLDPSTLLLADDLDFEVAVLLTMSRMALIRSCSAVVVDSLVVLALCGICASLEPFRFLAPRLLERLRLLCPRFRRLLSERREGRPVVLPSSPLLTFAVVDVSVGVVSVVWTLGRRTSDDLLFDRRASPADLDLTGARRALMGVRCARGVLLDGLGLPVE